MCCDREDRLLQRPLVAPRLNGTNNAKCTLFGAMLSNNTGTSVGSRITTLKAGICYNRVDRFCSDLSAALRFNGTNNAKDAGWPYVSVARARAASCFCFSFSRITSSVATRTKTCSGILLVSCARRRLCTSFG